MITILATKSTIKGVNGQAIFDIVYFESSALHRLNFLAQSDEVNFDSPLVNPFFSKLVQEDVNYGADLINPLTSIKNSDEVFFEVPLIDRVIGSSTGGDNATYSTFSQDRLIGVSSTEVATYSTFLTYRIVGASIPGADTYSTFLSANPNVVFNYSNRGYSVGGFTASALNEIDGLDYSTESAINPSSALSSAKGYVFCLSSTTKGYSVGGETVPDTNGNSVTTVEALTYLTESENVLTATLTTAKKEGASFSSSTKGYAFGGQNTNQSHVNSIEALTFASETTALLSATTPVAMSLQSSLGNYTDGYAAGGTNGTNTSAIAAFNYSAETSSTLSATLAETIRNSNGVSSQTGGYVCSGIVTSTSTNSIYKLAFDTGSTSTLVATMNVASRGAASIQNATKGYIAGGYTGAYTSAIQYVDFVSETCTTISATLATARSDNRGLTPYATPSALNYSNRGYVLGGFNSSAVGVNDIDGLDYSNESAINPSAILSSSVGTAFGVSSTTKSYVLGGEATQNTNGTSITAINGLTFLTEARSTLVAVLDSARSVGASLSSTVKGYVVGGKDTNQVYLNSIGNITFATEVYATNSATLPVTLGNSAAFGNDIVGYTSGGATASGVNTSAIYSLTYSNETVSTVSSTLPVAIRTLSGVSTGYVGYSCSGIVTSTSTTSIYKLDFITLVESTLSATLSVAARAETAIQNAIKGYLSGGYTTTTVNSIQYVNFADETTATLSATLSVARNFGAAATPYQTPIYFSGSTTKGYVCGSGDYSGTAGNYSNEIDGINFVDDTAINPSATLSSNKGWTTGLNTLNIGYVCSGALSTGSSLNSVEKFTFNTESITISSNTLSSVSSYSANRGASSLQKGYIFGGYNGTALTNSILGYVFASETCVNPSSTLTNTTHRLACLYNNTEGYPAGGAGGTLYGNIDKFTYLTESRVTTAVGLVGTMYDFGAFSGSFKGYYNGGDLGNGSNSNTIRALDYATTTVATLGTTLTQVRKNSSDLAVSENGYICGGDSGINPTKTYSNTIDKFNFVAETKSTPSATLTVARAAGCGLYPDFVNNSDTYSKVLAHFDGA